MKQEDKELLLKDLSARLPYGVKHCILTKERILTESVGDIHDTINGWTVNMRNIEEIRPYLRSMEDMTYEEEKFINQNINIDFYKMYGGVYLGHIGGCVSTISMAKILDYLNAHHFDYRGLIERGLAIKVTPDNNPYE